MLIREANMELLMFKVYLENANVTSVIATDNLP